MKLLIVESPNKVKTLKQFLPKDYVVEASVGHITRIQDSGLYNLGIDVKGNFNMDFVVDPGKKDVVKKLKELVSRADEVILASDPDREGEAIAYHLKNVLKIPEKKYKRVSYTEVTKRAVEEALKNPRKIDDCLVNAALGRSALDKIVGYRVSPVSKKKLGARSVGRCQSAALKIIVDREKEIINFKPETYYEIWLPFIKDMVDYKAQFKGLYDDKKVMATIKDENFAKKVLEDCKGNPYIVNDIVSTDRKVSPKPPFTTSTFQQEASSKLGYSVKTAMDAAQRLFEGIDIGGQHIALCTYLRTDSTSMDPEFQSTLKDFILNNYGQSYLGKLKEGKKAKNAQESHECFRCVDLTMTPDKLRMFTQDNQLCKVYELVYNRTIASMMTEAVITDTNYVIKNGVYKFVYTEHATKFDGFRRVYNLDDEEETKKSIGLVKGEELVAKDLEFQTKQTTPPSRFTEASLVQTLEKLGIGRPSTFASLINILLDPKRDYCKLNGKSMAPTELGMKLVDFLDHYFTKLVNSDYSALMEESLDKIANGELDRVDFLRSFYDDLEIQLKLARGVEEDKPQPMILDSLCPECGKNLIVRHGRYGDFIACTGWPKCKHTETIN